MQEDHHVGILFDRAGIAQRLERRSRAFAAAASRHDVIFLPDMLEGVALNPAFNQADGVHPNAAGVALIAQRLAPLVAQGLKSR